MNTPADRSAATAAPAAAPAARLVARLAALPLEWEEDAQTFTRTAPEAAAVFHHCANELAATVTAYSDEPERHEIP